MLLLDVVQKIYRWKPSRVESLYCGLILLTIFFAKTSTAQIQEPQVKENLFFTPINPTQSYSRPQSTPYYYNANSNNAQTIINNSNKQAKQMMGYNTPIVPPSDPILRHQFILNQYSDANSPNKANQQLKTIREILKEDNNNNNTSFFHKSKDNSSIQMKYDFAFEKLKSMLDGKTPLSIKSAYFEIENAFGNSYLTKEEYNTTISKSINFIKNWLIQNGYKLTDNASLNIGIQKFMSDTLSITQNKPDSKEPSKKITHIPFVYDYDDFEGIRDFRNYFSTKAFATGSGQCNSLPAVYLILAEGLGAKAHLTFAPMHSFIKYPDGSGYMKNYEPTSNWYINDRWYIENLFISKNAIYNRIYLDTLSKRQIIANCIIDLAHSYIHSMGANNESFLQKCVSSALAEFPDGNNINAYFITSSYLAYKVKAAMKKANINDIAHISKVPEAELYYKQYIANEQKIMQLGYQDLPTTQYQAIMNQHEFKGRRQAEKNINIKEKSTQFVENFK